MYKPLSRDGTLGEDGKEEEEEEEENEAFRKASTSSKASYRGLSEGHLHLRRLLSAFNPQFASSLASAHIYMCLEEWTGAPVIDNDHSPERDTTGEVFDEDSPLKRAQADKAKPLPPPEHNLYLDNPLSNKLFKKKDMDGLDRFYREVRSLYLSHGEDEAKKCGFGTDGSVSLESSNRKEQLRERCHLFPQKM